MSRWIEKKGREEKKGKDWRSLFKDHFKYDEWIVEQRIDLPDACLSDHEGENKVRDDELEKRLMGETHSSARHAKRDPSHNHIPF